MSEKGHLTAAKLEGIFQTLAREKFTGTLSIWDERAWKEFYFADTGGRMTSIGERKCKPIGEYLVRRAFITREALDTALELQKSKMTMLGEILVEKEDLEPERRDKALRWQFIDELADVFLWPGPHYELKTGPQTQNVSVVQRKRAETNTKSLSIHAPIHEIFKEAREIAEEIKVLQRELSPSRIYRITELGRQKLFVKGGFKALSDPEQRVVVLINGRHTLDDVKQKANVLPTDVMRIFHKLVKYGAVKMEG